MYCIMVGDVHVDELLENDSRRGDSSGSNMLSRADLRMMDPTLRLIPIRPPSILVRFEGSCCC